MFKIEASVLQEAVEQVTNSAKRARLAKGHIFVKAVQSEQIVKLYFAGETIQVQKQIEVHVAKDIEFATTILEFSLKASALPKDVEVTFSLEKNNNVKVAWGRESHLTLITAPETAPSIEIPDTVVDVKWGPNVFHTVARNFSGFCALENSASAERLPIITGVYLSKDDVGELVVEATNAVRGIRGIYSHEWFEESFAIPAESLNSIAELISTDGDVTLGLNEKRTMLVVRSGNTVALSRILSGKFPDLSRHYSDENAEIVWRADRLELLETARRIKRLGGLKPVIRTSYTGSKYFAVLDGVLSEQIGALIESEAKETFALNAENLEAALTVLRSEEVLIAFPSKDAPVTVLSGDEGDAQKLEIMLAQMAD